VAAYAPSLERPLKPAAGMRRPEPSMRGFDRLRKESAPSGKAIPQGLKPDVF
jgi:hypothetical protein